MTATGFPDRQTPNPGEIFLDHVGWYVPDMDAAAASFARLGFILTPFTAHSHAGADGTRVPSGTANRCAMLARGYLEILTHVPEIDAPLAVQLRDGLDRYTGLHLIAFTCSDAEAERARIAAAGFAPLPVAPLRRPIETDDGGEAMTRFSVIRLPPGSMAEGRIQMLSQDTPETVWQDSLITRDNAIDALTGVVVCTSDPAEAAARFARFTGRDAAPGPDCAVLALDRGRVVFATADRCARLIPGFAAPAAPYIAACVLRSRDLAETRRFLKGRGIRFTALADGAICIDPEATMGAYLVIHIADAPWPPLG